jgi:hypothetical protein
VVSEQLPDGGIELSAAEIDALDARWSSSWTPSEVPGHLAGIATPWYVAGGWAVDLFLGRQTRTHGDIEIGVPAGSFTEIRRRFPGFAFDAAGSGRIWQDATEAELAAVHQTWLRDRSTGNYMLEVFGEPHDGDTWICRQDASIRFPYDEIIQRTHDGIPYLTPELVLLFKAKHARQKDQADFDATLPRLTAAQRRTLGEFLTRVHPGHRWSAAVSAPPSERC